MQVQRIKERMQSLADPGKAALLRRFFKTGPGQYGEGDEFLGIVVPVIRAQVREFQGTTLDETAQLLRSPLHEERLLALLLLVRQYETGNAALKRSIYHLYLRNTAYINNWDLVDLTAPKIVGPFLQAADRKPLYRLARSKSLWERRIAVLSTFHYIKQRDFSDAVRIAGILLEDEEDLIHKAVGWMLREVGKRDRAAEEAFLRKHYRTMPRTMLRYAIERFPERLRKRYLNGTLPRRRGSSGGRRASR